MHHAVGRDRRLPRESLVDPPRRAVGLDQQILRRCREAERWAGHRLAGLDVGRAAGRLYAGRRWPRKGRLVAEAARRIDGAQQHLQDVDGAAGMEAVGMGRDAAHGMHRDRSTDHLVVAPPGPVGPGLVDHNGLLEGGMRQFGGDAPDDIGADTGLGGDGIGRVLRLEAAGGDEMEGRHRGAPVGQEDLAGKLRLGVDLVSAGDCLGLDVEHQRLARGVTGKQAVIGGALVLDHQPRRIGVSTEIFLVDLAGAQQFLDQRQDEQAVGSRPDADPFVGDRRIAGTNRIDRHELGGAARLEFAEADLDRIGIVVLGNAEHQEVPSVIPVRLAELPE